MKRSPAYIAMLLAGALLPGPAAGDMLSMEGIEPWEICAGCHGLDGAGNALRFPRIGGQPIGYILKQLGDFRAGRRTNDGGAMEPNASALTEDDVQRVAAWFAAQDPPPPDPEPLSPEAETLARDIVFHGRSGLPACVTCHVVGGQDAALPRISGQHMSYLAKQLHDFRDGARANDPGAAMRMAVRNATDAEIDALAAYLTRVDSLE
jgi:cytochrome c553